MTHFVCIGSVAPKRLIRPCVGTSNLFRMNLYDWCQWENCHQQPSRHCIDFVIQAHMISITQANARVYVSWLLGWNWQFTPLWRKFQNTHTSSKSVTHISQEKKCRFLLLHLREQKGNRDKNGWFQITDMRCARLEVCTAWINPWLYSECFDLLHWSKWNSLIEATTTVSSDIRDLERQEPISSEPVSLSDAKHWNGLWHDFCTQKAFSDFGYKVSCAGSCLVSFRWVFCACVCVPSLQRLHNADSPLSDKNQGFLGANTDWCH